MQPTKTTPRDFFLYLAAIVTLYTAAVSLLHIWFQVINALLPDPLEYVSYYSNSLRISVAFLVVAFPLTVLLTKILQKELIAEPARRGMAIRKWLLYLTLFVAGATLGVDLVVLIQQYLGGELTLRVFLKVLVVFIVAGGVFGAILGQVRESVAPTMRRFGYFIAAASVVVIGSLVFAFFVMGSPRTARLARFDDERVSDLSLIYSNLSSYYYNTTTLPGSLDALEAAGYGTPPEDPETGASYGYRKLAANRVELCATFALPSPKEGDARSRGVVGPYGTSVFNPYEHDAGDVCFEAAVTRDDAVKPVPVR